MSDLFGAERRFGLRRLRPRPLARVAACSCRGRGAVSTRSPSAEKPPGDARRTPTAPTRVAEALLSAGGLPVALERVAAEPAKAAASEALLRKPNPTAAASIAERGTLRQCGGALSAPTDRATPLRALVCFPWPLACALLQRPQREAGAPITARRPLRSQRVAGLHAVMYSAHASMSARRRLKRSPLSYDCDTALPTAWASAASITSHGAASVSFAHVENVPRNP